MGGTDWGKINRGENCIMMDFTACILHRILLGRLNQGDEKVQHVARMVEGNGV
jgi:hypothetical protein